MAEICLLDQGFVKDEKMSVAAAMAAVAKEAGCALQIVEYVRAKVGEA
jgi:elongation factor Ts